MDSVNHTSQLEHTTPSLTEIKAASYRSLAVAGNPHRSFDPVVLRDMLARMEEEGDTPVYDRLMLEAANNDAPCSLYDPEMDEILELLKPMGTVIDDTNFGVAPPSCGCF